MRNPRRLVLILQVVTASALLAAAAFIAWPPAVAVDPVAPTLPALAASAPPMQTPATALTDSIVDANIFSLSREAPESRTFVGAPVDPLLTGVPLATSSADGGLSDTLATSNSDPVPSLYGVVTGPLGAAALLRLDPAKSGSRLYRLGDGAAGYRVRSIGTDRVELDGPSGTIVLTLATRGGTP